MSGLNRESLRRACVLVVGDVMLDRYWFGDAHRISPEAPVPVVRVGRTDDRLGGAANVARNAAALGASTALLGVIGADEPGERVQALLEQSGVKSLLQVDPTLATTLKLRVVARTQQLLRLDFEHAPAENILLAKLEEFANGIADDDVVIFSDYGKGGLAHLPEMMRIARSKGCTILVDPKGSDYERYRGAHIITPNRSELREVIGPWHSEAELIEKAQALRAALDLRALLLTRSEEGMSLFTASQVLHVPTQAQEVFDVSGAGDTVIATLAGALGAGATLEDAVRLANRAAGIVVGKLGTAVVAADELWPEQVESV